jgi:hypothetical protein
MKFVLKDGFIHIVNSEGIANNNVVAEVVTKYVDNYKKKKFQYKVNNGKFLPLQHNQIEFTKEDYEKGTVNVLIQAVEGTRVEYFTADQIPVTFAVIFGRRIEEAYPEVIQHILERLDRMDVVLTNVIDAMAEVDKKGNLL